MLAACRPSRADALLELDRSGLLVAGPPGQDEHAFRFDAERLFELGFLNRLVETDELMPAANAMARHLLTLPPASRANTLAAMRAMRQAVSPGMERFANRLREHGAKSDLMESRAAFAEKREPHFKGWNDPADRFRRPTYEP